ncbi:MAG: DUF4846 domain-containing protein [Clostridia bacterium]|nr:DUF4846 domain-containing protein [Clostridia bacterium]
MKKLHFIFLITVLLLSTACAPPRPPTAIPIPSGVSVLTAPPINTADPHPISRWINPEGNSIRSRFTLPEGFARVQTESEFAAYLRALPLEPDGTVMHYFNGSYKTTLDYDAIIVTPNRPKKLLNSAQAIYRLRLSYLYEKGLYDRITVNFYDGFTFSYNRWRAGEVLGISGVSVYWKGGGAADNSLENFEKYLDEVNNYCNLTTLSRMLSRTTPGELKIGDVLLRGEPPHALIVLDMAKNAASGEIIYLFGQGGTPAQPIYVVRNPEHGERSPWYSSQDQSSWTVTGGSFGSKDYYKFS